MTKVVVVKDVHKSFGSREVLRGLNLEVESGEVVCILGASGSGKSTFLRTLNHLETVDDGLIFVNGELIGHEIKGGRLHELPERKVCAQRRRIGMVFQGFNLFGHRTAIENVMEGPINVLGVSRSDATARARELLEQVGLGGHLHSYASQLSGGQQQRVAIARCLAMRPSLMLFDEPTSALDPELVSDVLGVMRDLARDGMTMIVVTHEIAFARDVADRIVIMAEGVIVENGPPEQVLSHPSHPLAKKFLANVRH